MNDAHRYHYYYYIIILIFILVSFMQFKIPCMFSTVNQNMYFTDLLECIALKINFYLTTYFVINKLKLKKI